MGGKKKQLTTQATQRSASTADLEATRASQLNQELSERKRMLNTDIYGSGGIDEQARRSATDLRETGGFDPNQVANLRNQYGTFGDATGRGREGYEELSKTGGFNPQQQQDFLQSAVGPTQAMYARTKDEMARRLSLQGGYSPGFSTSQARLARQTGQDIGRAQLQGRVSLADQIRQGQQVGLAGLERTKSTMEGERLAGLGEARGLETSIAAGRQQGDDALQRFKESGVNALNQLDITSLQNRAQSGQLTQADAQLLAALAANEKSTFDKIMGGIGTVAGAVTGIARAFK